MSVAPREQPFLSMANGKSISMPWQFFFNDIEQDINYSIYSVQSNVRYWSAKGDGITDDTQNILKADAFCFGNDLTLNITRGDYLISEDITLTSNVINHPGAKFIANSAYRVTCTGTYKCGLTQGFGTNVSATFGQGAIKWALPQWFGSGTDNVLKAVNSGYTGGSHVVYLVSGDYPSVKIPWPSTYQTIMLGAGYRSTTLIPQNTDETAFIHIGPLGSDSYKPYIKQIRIQTTETCGHGIFSDVPGIGPDFEDIFIKGLTGVGKAGIYLKESFFVGLKNIRIDSTYDGLTVDRSKGVMAFSENWIAGCPNINLNIIDGQDKTGTVSMLKDSLILVGVGTAFEDDFQISVNGRITWTDDFGTVVVATIDSITDNLEIIVNSGFSTNYPGSITTNETFGTFGTSSGNEMQFAEIGLAAIDKNSQAIYCESSNQTIEIAFYENFTNARSIEYTSTARNNLLQIENASTLFIRNDGFNNRLPLGLGTTLPGISGSEGFIGPLIGSGPITNLFWNSSYSDNQSSGFTGVSTSVEAGTIENSGDNQIIGSGTSFLSDADIIVGGNLNWEDDAGASVLGRILSITAEDELTLTEATGSITSAGTAFTSTFQPLRQIINTDGFLDNNSLSLDWGEKASVNGSIDGVNSNQTFDVTKGETLHAMMAIKGSRDFDSGEYIQMRIIGAGSENRAIVPISKLYTDRWSSMVLTYKVEVTEKVRLRIDLIAALTHTQLTTYHDDFLITLNTKYPTYVYNPEPLATTTHDDGLYIGRFNSQRATINGPLTMSQALIAPPTRVTDTYQILVTDNTVFCNTDGGDYTVTLPAGTEGQEIRVVNTGTSGNTLTVNPSGLELLIGVNMGVTKADGVSTTLTYNTTDGWF